MNEQKMRISVIGQENRIRLRYLLVHAAIWVVYITLELSALFNYGQRKDPLTTYICFYMINIGLFYNLVWSLGRAGDPLPLILLRCTGVVAAYVTVKFCINILFYPSVVNVISWSYLRNFVVSTLLRGYIFAFPAIFYWVARSLGEQKNRALEAGHRLDQARNALLQQQLDPHLLFNTLSFVYEKVHRNSPEGAKALELLTDLLHYTTRHTTPQALTDVAAEVEQIRNLIGINDFRFAGTSRLRVRVTMDERTYPIIPLILLTLTENIFKHGELTGADSEASLDITASEGRLCYRSRNTKKTKNEKGSGLGLRNIRLRLEHAYPNKHRLSILETETIFEVELNIDLCDRPVF